MGGPVHTWWAGSRMMSRRTSPACDFAASFFRCTSLPVTFLRAYGLPHMQKFIQVPGLLVMLDELNAAYRQVFTDGRPLPVDPQPAWSGYSSGEWAGDTLVIDSIGFRDDLWLDIAGSP